MLAQTTTSEPESGDDEVIDAVETLAGSTVGDWVAALVTIVIAVILARVIRMVLARFFDARGADSLLGDLIGRIVGYVVVAFGVVYAMESLGVAVGPILGALGVVGIALAFALQAVLENFVAGVILQVRRPFTYGDEIRSLDHDGVVQRIDSRTTTLRTYDGETVRLPNAEVFNNALTNHSALGRRRTTLMVDVAYGTDLTMATAVTTDAVRGVPAVLDHPAAEVWVREFGGSGIQLAVLFWHGPSIRDRWEVRHAVAVAIDRAYADAGISIPFPQRTLHVRSWPDEAGEVPGEG